MNGAADAQWVSLPPALTMGKGLTVNENAVVAVAPSPSVTVRVMVVVPVCPAAGLIVTVRLAPDPPSTRLALGTNGRFEEVAVTVRLAVGVSASPTVNATGEAPAPWQLLWLATEPTVGSALLANLFNKIRNRLVPELAATRSRSPSPSKSAACTAQVWSTEVGLTCTATLVVPEKLPAPSLSRTDTSRLIRLAVVKSRSPSPSRSPA